MTVILAGRYAALTLATALAISATGAQADDDLHPYARVDVGYSFSSAVGGDIYDGTGFGGNFGRSPVFGGGVGTSLPLALGPVSFRADLTASSRPSLGGAHSASYSSAVTGAPATISSDLQVADSLGLASLYGDVDVGCAYHPFFGIGIGEAWNRLKTQTYSLSDSSGASFSQAGAQRRQFAYQLSVGVTTALRQDLHVEIAYHYLNAGSVSSGTSIQFPDGSGATTPALQNRLVTNDITVGLRFSF